MRKIWIVLIVLLLVGVILGQAQDVPDLDWQDRVFYEVFVRSFYDGDGDGIGDLRGLIKRLDYLNDGDPTTTDDLGITGIWLMPVAESPSYHGYDVTNYRVIERDYGTNEDFREFMAEAHARGIAVIVDLVVNHTSVQHPWFVDSARGPESPYDDYYVWSEDNPGYGGPDNQKVWHELNGRWYYGLFWDGMPDLNYNNPVVTSEMEDIARFWLEDMGVDGFRLDAIKHIVEEGQDQEHTGSTLAWMRDFNGFIKQVNPDALTVGEVWSGSPIVARYVPDAVDMAFEFDLAATMVDAARRRSGSALAQVQARALELYPQYAAFLTNHDQNRVMTEMGGDVGAAKVAASLLLTGPGIPFIYYGEEIGMQGQKPDPRIRTPMQWGSNTINAEFTTGDPWEPLSDGVDEFNVADQIVDPDSLLNHYRALIHLRNDHEALRRGEMTLIDSSERPVYAFLRHTENEILLVLINMNHREMTGYTLSLEAGPLAGVNRAEVLLGAGTANLPDINEAGGFTDYVPLATLPPRSTTIIRLVAAE